MALLLGIFPQTVKFGDSSGNSASSDLSACTKFTLKSLSLFLAFK